MVLTSSQVSGLYFDPYEAKRIRVHSHFSRAQILLRMLSCTNSLSFSVQTINFFYLSQVLNHVHLFWNFEIVMILFVYYYNIFVVQIGVSVSGEQKNSTAETVSPQDKSNVRSISSHWFIIRMTVLKHSVSDAVRS